MKKLRVRVVRREEDKNYMVFSRPPSASVAAVIVRDHEMNNLSFMDRFLAATNKAFDEEVKCHAN